MMERRERVAKLEALLARVQSRAGENGARLASVSGASSAGARALHAVPSASPGAPRVEPAAMAAAPAPAPSAADDAPTAIHSLDVEAAMAAAKESGTIPAAPIVAAAPAPAPVPTPAPAPAPAFRGVSALGALSKKATLIGTAPPANWPPRGAETSVVTEAPKPSPAERAAAEAAPPAPAPDVQASAAEAGDVDALMGGGEERPPVSEPKPAPAQALEVHGAPMATTSSSEDVAPAPVIQPERKPAKRSASPVIAFIVIWLILIAAIWFAYKKSM